MAALTINQYWTQLKAEKTEKKVKRILFWYLHEYTLDGATNPLHGCMLNRQLVF